MDRRFLHRTGSFPLGKKTFVMGILNITPDSFFDGGRIGSTDDALRRCLIMEKEGADIIDVGGESTRPGHSPVTADEELCRVIPVIERLSNHTALPISIDTTKAAVAKEAALAGASIINDVWGLGDPLMAKVCADTGCAVIIGHNDIKTGSTHSVMERVSGFFKSRLGICADHGITDGKICLDPGIGFGKSYEENLEVLRRLGELKSFGLPLMLGVSRKSVIGLTLNLPTDERLEGSLALAVLGASMGADFIRAHDVRATVRALLMADAIIRHSGG